MKFRDPILGRIEKRARKESPQLSQRRNANERKGSSPRTLSPGFVPVSSELLKLPETPRDGEAGQKTMDDHPIVALFTNLNDKDLLLENPLRASTLLVNNEIVFSHVLKPFDIILIGAYAFRVMADFVCLFRFFAYDCKRYQASLTIS